MRANSPRYVCLAALIAMAIAPLPSFAQSTGLLTGTVVDSSGAVVPQAKVICRNVDTDLQSAAASNNDGLFRFPDLPVGSYELKAYHDGFATLIRGGIRLLTDQTVDLTLTLHVGHNCLKRFTNPFASTRKLVKAGT